jgi:ElaB/YqjD/DUF883 family membrane-anchored ribosome-binding protein
MPNNIKDKATDAAAAARAKADETYQKARTKASGAAASTRASAAKAGKKTAEGLEKNPLAALVGGLAIGAIAAALLPRTKREDNMVGTMGNKVRSTARDAAKTARNVGKEQLDALGISTEAAREQLRDIAGKIGKAASTASSAAADTIKKK